LWGFLSFLDIVYWHSFSHLYIYNSCLETLVLRVNKTATFSCPSCAFPVMPRLPHSKPSARIQAAHTTTFLPTSYHHHQSSLLSTSSLVHLHSRTLISPTRARLPRPYQTPFISRHAFHADSKISSLRNKGSDTGFIRRLVVCPNPFFFTVYNLGKFPLSLLHQSYIFYLLITFVSI